MRGPIATYVGGLLMLYTLFSTDLQAAEFPPKGAVPISAPLYLDKRRMGMAQMLVMPDPQLSYVQATPLLTILNGLVQEERLKEMESTTTQGFFALQDAAKVGIDCASMRRWSPSSSPSRRKTRSNNLSRHAVSSILPT